MTNPMEGAGANAVVVADQKEGAVIEAGDARNEAIAAVAEKLFALMRQAAGGRELAIPEAQRGALMDRAASAIEIVQKKMGGGVAAAAAAVIETLQQAGTVAVAATEVAVETAVSADIGRKLGRGKIGSAAWAVIMAKLMPHVFKYLRGLSQDAIDQFNAKLAAA